MMLSQGMRGHGSFSAPPGLDTVAAEVGEVAEVGRVWSMEGASAVAGLLAVASIKVGPKNREPSWLMTSKTMLHIALITI